MRKTLRLLQNSKIVKKYETLDVKRGKDFYYLKIRADIKNNTELYIREYMCIGDEKYSYHWQGKDGTLITRWDNAPHQKVKTFPHHKHLSDGTVVESYEIVLEKVLKSIETKLGVKP